MCSAPRKASLGRDSSPSKRLWPYGPRGCSSGASEVHYEVSWPVEKILEEAFKLDRKDRALVVAERSSPEGIGSPEEVETAWREEIAQRVKSLEYGTAVLHEWDEVNEEITSILKGA